MATLTLRRLGTREAVTGSLAFAAASLLAPSVPTTDPWGWIVWGRQVLELRLNTVAGPPSWKPLPVLFTAPLSLLGPAAPDAWLLIARAGGLLALWLAFTVAARMAGPVAGCLAAAALLLSGGWVHGWAHGYSEGLAVAALLGAVEAHRCGRRELALGLGVLVCLSRPEALPFALLYAVVASPWRWWPLLALVPALWVLPDWWGSGQLLHASTVARVNLLRAGAHPGLNLLRGTYALLPAPVWVCALAGMALAARRREWTLLVLGLAAVVWIGVEALATAHGYPGAARFLLAPAALACVAAGAGAAWALRRVPPAGIAALAVLALLGPLLALPPAANDALVRARFQLHLRAAVAQAGGARLLRLGPPVIPGRLWWSAGALAWDLHVPLVRIRKLPERQLGSLTGLRGPAVLFTPLGRSVPDDPDWVPTYAVRRCGLRVHALASSGTWRVLAVTPVRCGIDTRSGTSVH